MRGLRRLLALGFSLALCGSALAEGQGLGPSVISVAGKTGALTLVCADLTNVTPLCSSTSATSLTVGGSGIFLMSAFGSDASQTLYELAGADGATFNWMSQTGVYSGAGVMRDPSMIQYANQFCIASTSTANASTSFNIACSPYLTHGWASLVNVSFTGQSATNVWAPKFFIDSDGSVHIFVAVSADSQTSFTTYEIHSTVGNINNASQATSDLTTWSTPVAVSGTGFPTKPIDPFVIKIGSTYYFYFADAGSTYIDLASSTSLTSGYTVTQTGNWSSWGPAEAADVVPMPDGTYRMYMDIVPSHGCQYSDSANGISGWSAPTHCAPFGVRHPDVLRVTNVNTIRQIQSDMMTSTPAFFTASGRWIVSGDSVVYALPDSNHKITSNINGNWAFSTTDPMTFAAPSFSFDHGITLTGALNKVTVNAPTTAAALTFGTDNATITFQGTDTYVGRGTTDTFTNKTYDTAGTGNVFKVNGNGISAVTGTGATVALSAGPTFTGTDVLATAQATTLAAGGCTIGTNAICATGTAIFSGAVTASGGLQAASGQYIFWTGAGGFITNADHQITMVDSGAAHSFIFTVNSNNRLQLGALDAASPAAQTIQPQSVVAGTSNTAGANFTIAGSAGTGTGIGGSLLFQVAPAGSTGTAQNALATALTIDSTKLATFAGGVTVTGATTLSSALTYGGVALSNAVTGTGNMVLSQGPTLRLDAGPGTAQATIFNGTSTGESNIYYQPNSGLGLDVGAKNSAFVTSGILVAGMGFLQDANAAGIGIRADAGPIIFASGGTAMTWQMGSSGGFYSASASGTDKGSGTINIHNAYYDDGTAGVTASGAVSCTITAVKGGIVTAASCS